MPDKTKNLKLFQNQNFSSQEGDTPTPLLNRARRLRSLEDAEKLLSRSTNEYLKGKSRRRQLKQLFISVKPIQQFTKNFYLKKD